MKKLLILTSTILILTLFTFAPFQVMAAEVDLNSLGTDNETQETVVDDNTLPESYSSLDLGYCSDVKYQDGNICWVYASIASLESLFIKEGFLTADPDFNNDLSESLLDQWGTYEENGEGWQRSSKESGYTNISIGYLTSWNGPYTENGIYTNLGVTSLVYLGKNEMSKIKEMIMQSGAVTANFNSHSYAYSKDKNSYCLTDEISEILGHTVSVVGWDDNYSKENFDGNYQPENDGAWLCKNSWGSNNNSIGGYLWISYEDYYLFNDDYFDPSFGIDTYQKIDDNDYLYQNEKYGATYEFKYVSGDDITYYNVFDFSENGNVLDKIIFESTAKGAEYSVYFTPVDENGTPVSDKTKWQFLSSGTVDYRGYICCDIEDTTVSQCKGAIAVEIDTSAIDKTDGSNITSSLGVCEWLRDRESQQMILVHQGQRGQSYIDYNGGIYDIMDVYNDLGDSSGGTFVIKAVTNGTVDTTTLGDVNLDGKANINDATLIQKYINKNVINLVDHQLVNADYNKDGKIDINDVTAIQKNMAK